MEYTMSSGREVSYTSKYSPPLSLLLLGFTIPVCVCSPMEASSLQAVCALSCLPHHRNLFLGLGVQSWASLCSLPRPTHPHLLHSSSPCQRGGWGAGWSEHQSSRMGQPGATLQDIFSRWAGINCAFGISLGYMISVRLIFMWSCPSKVCSLYRWSVSGGSNLLCIISK